MWITLSEVLHKGPERQSDSSAATDDTAGSLFDLVGVCVSRGPKQILHDLTVEVPDVPIVGISGPSGSGKSTLLRLLNRLAVPDSGHVLFRGCDVSTLDPLALRRRVGMVFQRPTMFEGTVADNLLTADPAMSRPSLEEAVSAVGLEASLLQREARALSGGEAQRLCLARALATGPEVLLLDEPTSALDPESAATVEELALSLARAGVRQIWVSHDESQLERLAATHISIADGRIR